MKHGILSCGILATMALQGCGLSYSRLPEPWDTLNDPDATYHMEKQVKNAIFCELSRAVRDVREMGPTVREQNGVIVSTTADELLPDTWGVLVQLTLQADEKSALTPGVSLKTPLPNAPVNFPGEVIGATGPLAATTYGPASIAQSFSLGLGGQLSSENIRYDKYNFYYSAKDLATKPNRGSTCRADFEQSTPKSSSSPFLDASSLGIHDWLLSAVRVIDFHRSSRKATNGEGAPLGVQGTQSDSSQYDNKFVIINDANVAPTWNLVRVGTPTSPLFDTNRTRTHELLMTVAPAQVAEQKDKKTGQKVLISLGPSEEAREAHLAALIGSAVANAVRPQ